ncbi:MinD/ParA family protein [Halarsenatibacter silvermanii]|nr:MinD/ParA family protein [Halarsenatibacter silvermanii]
MFPDSSEEDEKAEDRSSRHRSRVVSIASGKGGVGKTNITVNLGLALQKLDKDVLILDADMGMANVDVVLGMTARYHLGHVLEDKCSIEDALLQGPSGITVLPGASGVNDFIDIEIDEVKKLLELSAAIEDEFDFIIMDIGAGAHKGVVNFIRAADEIMVVLTPEPTAVMDAYSLLKILSDYALSSRLNLVVNQVENRREGEKVTERMENAIREYLEIDVDNSTLIPYDSALRKSVKKQNPMMEIYPNSKAGKAFSQLAEIMAFGAEKEKSRGMKGFVYRMLGFFRGN